VHEADGLEGLARPRIRELERGQQMGVIQEAIAEARNPAVSTADLLRTCQVIAYHIRDDSLKLWVQSELNGYPGDAQIPDYRELDGLRLKGTFVNAARWIKNVDVPVTALPEAYREAALRNHLHAPIAELEGLVRTARGGALKMTPVPPEVYARLEIFDLMTTMDLWCELSTQSVAGIVDQVRTRALTLLLELEVENPDAGDRTGPIQGPEPARVAQLVQTVIYGNNVMIAAGSGANAQQVVVAKGDLESLLSWARSAGIPDAEVLELPKSIERTGQSLGVKTRRWAARAAKSAAGVGREVAVGVIEAEVKHYLGLP
jgi:hypothetical protein